MSLRTWLLHKKIQLLGDKLFEELGCKVLPCERCDAPFMSFLHYGGWNYVFDSLCKDCIKDNPLNYGEPLPITYLVIRCKKHGTKPGAVARDGFVYCQVCMEESIHKTYIAQ